MLHEADEVALYAIMLREAARNRHTCPDSLLDDLSSSCPGEVSLATLLAHRSFTDLDWDLAEMLCDHPERTLKVAQNLFEYEEPLVAEALLHARGPRCTQPSAQWAESFRGRWRNIRGAIGAFEREGIATKFEDADRMVDDIWRAATSASHEELLEKFYDPIWEKEARAAVA